MLQCGPLCILLSSGERDLDKTTRGLGGTPANPLTTCGEENLTMVDDRCVGSRCMGGVAGDEVHPWQVITSRIPDACAAGVNLLGTIFQVGTGTQT
jgi:hypothetical protein